MRSQQLRMVATERTHLAAPNYTEACASHVVPLSTLTDDQQVKMKRAEGQQAHAHLEERCTVPSGTPTNAVQG